ncbi:MAG: sulfatase-like hydrolase/transferase [Thermoplasmata archaeon]
MDTPPNVVIIVLDCVRAQDFPGGKDPVPGMPSVDSLIHHGVVFPRAIAPSPWTLPSHASILTGLPPWEHNLHLRGRLFLDPTLHTLPKALESRGYRTSLLSGNALLSHETGFSSQFQDSVTSEWWEPFLRHTSFVPTSDTGLPRSTPATPSSSVLLQRLSVELLLRYPAIIDSLNRVSARTVDPGTLRSSVSPWIEPAFNNWLVSQPREIPLFSMINLIDAHDPYLTDNTVRMGLRAWWRQVSVPQQGAAYRFNGLKASPERMRVLRDLYRKSIQSLDSRVGNIVESLRRAGRWDNTLFIVTSDHGQALLEKGHLFHGMRVDEQLTRIPMVVRFPGDEFESSVGQGWTSLTDIAALVGNLAGLKFQGKTSVDMRTLIDGPRTSPVVAISDGIMGGRAAAAWIPHESLPGLYNVLAAVYSLDWKVIVDQHSTDTSAFNLDSDPAETANVWATEGMHLESEATLGRDVIERVIGSHHIAASPEVRRRLEGWGYV